MDDDEPKDTVRPDPSHCTRESYFMFGVSKQRMLTQQAQFREVKLLDDWVLQTFNENHKQQHVL